MIHEHAKLNPNMFSYNVEERPTRDGFGKGLLSLGKENENVVALSADLLESTRVEEFARAFPKRFFEVGVAEQNLATIAAGLALSGKIPFITSYATFSPGRNWEQIRTTICYNNANVKIAGHHAGLMTGPDGATHQALEDIAIMRALPNMQVIVPCDAIEAEKATRAAIHMQGPVYLRFARDKSPIVTTSETPFIPGKIQVMYESKRPKVILAACGVMVSYALHAAEELEKEKIGCAVLNVHTIKPLDTKTIIEYVKQAGAVVSIEEHQIYGGLGGAIAETLMETFPAPQEFVGVRDAFGESGTPKELFLKYGLSVEAIKQAAKKAIKRAGK